MASSTKASHCGRYIHLSFFHIISDNLIKCVLVYGNLCHQKKKKIMSCNVPQEFCTTDTKSTDALFLLREAMRGIHPNDSLPAVQLLKIQGFWPGGKGRP